ncbi:MAG: HipA family kinase [Acidithiobacillus sp.]
MTRPFICRGDDDHVYFVKGHDAPVGAASSASGWRGSWGWGWACPLRPSRS